MPARRALRHRCKIRPLRSAYSRRARRCISASASQLSHAGRASPGSSEMQPAASFGRFISRTLINAEKTQISVLLRSSAPHLSAFSEAQLQAHLDVPRLAHGKNASEEWSKVWIRPGNPQVGMIESIEGLGSEFQAARFTQGEAPVQRQVKYIVSRTGDDVAPGIAERKR